MSLACSGLAQQASLATVREPASREAVIERIAEILSRRGFEQGESWLDALLRDLFEGLGFSAGALPRIGVLLTALVVAGVLTWLILRAWHAGWTRAPAHRSSSLSAAGVRHERATQFASQARDAQARGDLRAALRLYFWALVIALSRRGELEYNAAWTNRELLVRGAPEPATAARLAPWVDALDVKGFGNEPVSEGDVARLAELCGQVLGSAA